MAANAIVGGAPAVTDASRYSSIGMLRTPLPTKNQPNRASYCTVELINRQVAITARHRRTRDFYRHVDGAWRMDES